MKRSLLALGLAVALPFAAANAAEGISWNYVEGGYAATNSDLDADGFGLNGSVAVHPNFHVFGGYMNQEIDGTSIDFDQWRLGVGYNHEISRNADLVTRIAYEKFDAGRDGFGNRYLMILNRDFYEHLDARLSLKGNYRVYEISRQDGLQRVIQEDTQTLPVSLNPGDAILLRLQDALEEPFTVEYRNP